MYYQSKYRSMSPIRKSPSRDSSLSSLSSNESFTSIHNFSSSSRFSNQYLYKLKNPLPSNQDECDQMLNPGHEYLVRDLPLGLFRRYNHSHEYLNKQASLSGASYFPQFNYTNLGNYDAEGKRRVRRSLTPIPFESKRSQEFNPIPLSKSLSVQISPYKDSMLRGSASSFRVGHKDEPKTEYRSLASRVFSKYLDGKAKSKDVEKNDTSLSIDKSSSDQFYPDEYETSESDISCSKTVDSPKPKKKQSILESESDSEKRELYFAKRYNAYRKIYSVDDDLIIDDDEISKDKLGIFRKILNYEDIKDLQENTSETVSNDKLTLDKDKINSKKSEIMEEPSGKQMPTTSSNQKVCDVENNEQKNKKIVEPKDDKNKCDINVPKGMEANMLEDMSKKIDSSASKQISSSNDSIKVKKDKKQDSIQKTEKSLEVFPFDKEKLKKDEKKAELVDNLLIKKDIDLGKKADNYLEIETVSKKMEENVDMYSPVQLKMHDENKNVENNLPITSVLNRLDKKIDKKCDDVSDIDVEIIDIDEDLSETEGESKGKQKDSSKAKKLDKHKLPLIMKKEKQKFFDTEQSHPNVCESLNENQSSNQFDSESCKLASQEKDNELAQKEKKNVYNQFFDKTGYKENLKFYISSKAKDSEDLIIIMDDNDNSKYLNNKKKFNKTQEKCQSKIKGANKSKKDESSLESFNLSKSNNLSKEKEPEDNKERYNNEQKAKSSQSVNEEKKSHKKVVQQEKFKENIHKRKTKKSEVSESQNYWLNCLGSCFCEEEAMLPTDKKRKKNFYRKILNYSMLAVILVLIFTIITYEWAANKNKASKAGTSLCDCLLSDKEIC